MASDDLSRITPGPSGNQALTDGPFCLKCAHPVGNHVAPHGCCEPIGPCQCDECISWGVDLWSELCHCGREGDADE